MVFDIHFHPLMNFENVPKLVLSFKTALLLLL